MLSSLKLQLGLKQKKSSRADMTEPRPYGPSSMISTKRRRRSAEVLRHDDPVIDNGRDSGQRDGSSGNTGAVDSGFTPKSVTQTCRHDFVKSCFLKLCDVGSSRCTVCQRFIWKFWKIQTCVDCGEKKHKNCVFVQGFDTARTAQESGDQERIASPSFEEVNYCEPSALIHPVRDRDESPLRPVDETEYSEIQTSGLEASNKTLAVIDSELDQVVTPQEDSTEPTRVLEVFEETRSFGLKTSAAHDAIETSCADGDRTFGPASLERIVRVTTQARLECETFGKIQTAELESSTDKTHAVIGDRGSPDVRENDSKPDQKVAPQEASSETTRMVESSKETRAIGQTSGAIEAGETGCVGETGCADNGSAVELACLERSVLVVTPAPLEGEAFEKGQTAGLESSLTQTVTGDCELVENDSEPDERVAPQEASAETTETEPRAAVSTAEEEITTVGEDRSVATSSDDKPLVAVDPTVRRSPTVREGNVQLYTKYKILPRKNAYWQMTNYMKRVNTFLNNPQEQTSIEHLTKYWLMQNKLFSLFSSGILLDEESFFSVCPEILSIHIADKCRCETIIDPFCGAGGNIIQFTKTCSRVIGVDVDAKKIKLARNNARVYGVENRIQLMTGDYFESGARPKADIVFMSPPWGGPEYINKPSFSLAAMCSEHGGGRRILEIAREIAPKIAIHLPRNLDKNECVMLAHDLNFKYIQFERNYIGNQFNSTTMYLK